MARVTRNLTENSAIPSLFGVNPDFRYLRKLAIGATLALAACGQPNEVISTPPAEWTKPVDEPPVPEMADDTSVANYIVALIDRLREANNRLQRLDDWREGVKD